MTSWSTVVDSPLGPLTLRATETAGGAALSGLWLRDHRHGPDAAERAGWIEDRGPFREVADQLDAWFAGDRRDFAVPLHSVGTPFQRRVWDGLTAIPYGETRSYRQLAAALGVPGASRAVGAANGRNPISIVVPCHRVVGADGSLTGYGGGTAAKRWLLDHERRNAGLLLF